MPKYPMMNKFLITMKLMTLRTLQTVQLPPKDFQFDSRRELQSGGFARVFAVKFGDEEVAVKVPHVAGSSEEEEIANLTSVAHRNIVRFFGTVRYDDRKCLVLELSSWGSIRDLLRNGCLELLRTGRSSWILDIARAMRYLHSDAPVPLVHGDLKGGNVLLFDAPGGGSIAKVSDFGQSRPLYNTTAVQNMGTHLWSAPEVLMSEGHSQRSDVWSFGCTTVELFSEREPYHHLHQGDARKIKKLLRRVENRELDPLSGLQVAWPPHLQGIVQRCLKMQHQDRPGMEAVLRDLTPENGGTGGIEERPASNNGGTGGIEERPASSGSEKLKEGKSKKGKDVVDGKTKGRKSKKTKHGNSLGENEGNTTTVQPAAAAGDPDPIARSKALYLSCWSPDGALEVQMFELRSEHSFGEARKSFKGIFRLASPRARSIFFSEEGKHLRDGRQRSCVGYFDTESNRLPDRDLQDGGRVEPSSLTLVIWRFLDDRSELPRTPRFPPHIVIHNDSELLQMSGRRTAAAPVGAFRQTAFLAFLWGVKCGSAEPRLFWSITGRGEQPTFASPEGTVVVGAKAIDGAQDRNYFFLLLQNGDQLPFIALPEGRHLEVRHRMGADVDVRNGRLVGSPAADASDLERWEAPVEASEFRKRLSAAASKNRTLKREEMEVRRFCFCCFKGAGGEET